MGKQSIKDKKLLLIGGVRPACEIITEAKKMGVETFVTDYLEDSPAKKIADHAYMIDATDVDAVVQLCKEQSIDGIITGYVDLLLPYCQRICQKLGKPFWGNADNIEMSINKNMFKDACERAGIPVVPWKQANKENYRNVLDNMALPLVMKPVDNSGSRGVYKCYDKANIYECAEKALAYSKCGEILIEQAMNPHNEFSVYYIMNNGNMYLTGMGDRYVNDSLNDIAPIGQGMLLPSIHLDEWKIKMDKKIQKFFLDNNMNDGFVFVQGFYEKGSFYIHEIGYRLNGGFSYKIIEFFSNYNQIQELIKFSLTGDMDEDEIKKSNAAFSGYGMIVTASLKPGKIGKISGIKDIEKEKGVLQFYQLHKIGEELLSTGTTAQVFAYILCASEKKEDLIEILNCVSEHLVVEDIEGNNMLNPILNPARLNFGGATNEQ